MSDEIQYHRWIRWAMGIVAGAAMVYSLYHGARYGFGVGFNKNDPIKVHQALFLGLWILVPPIWFWFEYFFLFGGNRDDLEEFKYEQDQAAKIWLALITVLLGLYFGKDLIRETSAEQGKQQSLSSQQVQKQSQSSSSSGASVSTPPQ